MEAGNRALHRPAVERNPPRPPLAKGVGGILKATSLEVCAGHRRTDGPFRESFHRCGGVCGIPQPDGKGGRQCLRPPENRPITCSLRRGSRGNLAGAAHLLPVHPFSRGAVHNAAVRPPFRFAGHPSRHVHLLAGRHGPGPGRESPTPAAVFRLRGIPQTLHLHRRLHDLPPPHVHRLADSRLGAAHQQALSAHRFLQSPGYLLCGLCGAAGGTTDDRPLRRQIPRLSKADPVPAALRLSEAADPQRRRAATYRRLRKLRRIPGTVPRFTNLPCPNAPTNCMRSFFHSAVLRPRA